MSTCILCAIDGSREAGRAAAVGARLARDLDARALLIHVDEDSRPRRFGVRWPAPRRARRKRSLLKATAVPVIGLAADLARRLGADLHIAVGSESFARGGESAEMRLASVLEGIDVEAHTHTLPLATDDAVERVASDERAVLAVVGPPETDEPSSVLSAPVAIRLAAAGSTALVVLPSKAELQVGSGHYELARAP